MELQTELHNPQHNALVAQIQSQSSDAEAKEQAEQVVMEYARKITRIDMDLEVLTELHAAQTNMLKKQLLASKEELSAYQINCTHLSLQVKKQKAGIVALHRDSLLKNLAKVQEAGS
jgi:hypothetical protein